MTEKEQKSALDQIMSTPASDALVEELAQMVLEVNRHEHPPFEDFFCLNHVSYMGERMGHMLAKLRQLVMELKQKQVENGLLKVQAIQREADLKQMTEAGELLVTLSEGLAAGDGAKIKRLEEEKAELQKRNNNLRAELHETKTELHQAERWRDIALYRAEGKTPAEAEHLANEEER